MRFRHEELRVPPVQEVLYQLFSDPFLWETRDQSGPSPRLRGPGQRKNPQQMPQSGLFIQVHPC